MNIICNPPDAFDITSNGVKPKQYPDDLVIYYDGKDPNLNLTEAPGMVSPVVPLTPIKGHVEIKGDETGDSYTFVDKDYELTYYKNNFIHFKSGCIRFTAKKEDSDYDFSYQDFGGFKGIEDPGLYLILIQSWTNGTYTRLPVYIRIEDENYTGTTEGLHRLSSKINETIDDNPLLNGVFYAEVINNCLRFRTKYTTGTATKGYIQAPERGNQDSLWAWFDDIHDPAYYCAPDVDTKILSIHEENGSNNEISVIHTSDEPQLLNGEADPGCLYLFMSDENSEYTLTKKICNWDWSNETWTEFELNFDESLSNFLVNGEVKAFFETVGVNADGTKYDSIVRSDVQKTFLTLGNNGDAYGFKEIDLFNKKQHCGAYKAPASVESYDDKNTYVEYSIGDVKVYDDSELKIEGEGNMLIEAYDNGVPLTITVDGALIPVAANSIEEFIKLFKAVDYDLNSTLSFEASDLTFRVTFLDKDAEITGFSFDPGTEVYDANDPYSFEDIYGWVRRQCGAPQVTCELTDDQIYDCLCMAVEKYNKYRNWNENLTIQDLNNNTDNTALLRKGYSKEEGSYYILPANINPKDIVDIFFQPRFSVCWFGAGDNFLNNVMAQTFFGLYGGIVQNSADYYIHRVSCNDISNIIGTQVSWRIYNNHLYFTPNNLKDLEQFTVGIKYRPALTVEEIRNSEDIKALTLAYAKRVLGHIRGTFGGSVQAGDVVIQLNAEMLLAEADKLEEKTINLLKSEQKPLWIIWS